MNRPFETAEWIWLPEAEALPSVNVYALFRVRFSGGAGTRLRVSVAGNYAAFVNGRPAAFGQYTDFPWRKTYAETDISPLCAGDDELLLCVHYSGNAFTSHYDGDPGIIAEILRAGGVVAASGADWDTVPDTRYAFGDRPVISGSLNYTFAFDATTVLPAWTPASVLAGRSRDIRPRPVDPPADRGFRPGRLLTEGPVYLFDLGKECAGLLQIEVEAPAGTRFDIAHGEYLVDGRLPARVAGFGERISSVDSYVAPGGRATFVHRLRRVGCRYIEVHVHARPEEAKVLSAGLRVVALGGMEAPPFFCSDPFFAKAHETTAETLRLCLHEKYENCPWREQSICAYDARNQQLFGYSLWGNYNRAAAMIRLFAEAQRGNGFLRAAAPSATKLWIPMFTFVWMASVYEYVLHSGDLALFDDLAGLIAEMLGKILSSRVGRLYAPPDDEGVWNYCESSNLEYCANPPNAFYNLYLREALLKVAALFAWRGEGAKASSFRAVADEIGHEAAARFYDPAIGGYFDSFNPETGENEFPYGHIQALFLAHGLVPEARVAGVVGGIRDGRFRMPSLAALPYLARGIFNHGSDADRDWFHGKIREIYGGMLADGATTWYEDARGRDYAGGRGSLCHGWSAFPALYEARYLLGITPLEPGFRRFRFHPFAPCGLVSASGSVMTPKGPILVSWRRGEGGIEAEVRAPDGCTCAADVL